LLALPLRVVVPADPSIKMDAYFHGPFPRHLTLLQPTGTGNLRIVSTRVIPAQEGGGVQHTLGGDASTVFFGGQAWKNVAADLAGIQPASRPTFVLSLFMVIITEQCLHAHFPAAHRAWRARTGFPLFGWSGFGVHNENPYHLLRAPIAAGLVDEPACVALAPALAALFCSEVAEYFSANGLAVNANAFFAALRADPTYQPATRGLIRGQDREQTAAGGGEAAAAQAPGAALVRAVAAALGAL
jgi:hypothetical protein